MCIRLELDLDSSTADQVCYLHGAPHELRLTFQFPLDSGSNDNRWIDGVVTIRQCSLSLDYGFACCGWDLVQFAESLRQLHAQLDGDAEFASQEGSVCVRLHVVDAGRGSIAVDVSLEQDVRSPFTEDRSFPLLEIPGFGIEQSYLREFATRIDGFLRETGVDLTHPMM